MPYFTCLWFLDWTPSLSSGHGSLLPARTYVAGPCKVLSVRNCLFCLVCRVCKPPCTKKFVGCVWSQANATSLHRASSDWLFSFAFSFCFFSFMWFDHQSFREGVGGIVTSFVWSFTVGLLGSATWARRTTWAQTTTWSESPDSHSGFASAVGKVCFDSSVRGCSLWTLTDYSWSRLTWVGYTVCGCLSRSPVTRLDISKSTTKATHQTFLAFFYCLPGV